jgi:hypothetical protein
MATAAVPWMMFFGARNLFTGEPAVALVATLLGTAYWWDAHRNKLLLLRDEAGSLHIGR